MNEIFLDTETTGLSFRDGHKIVEIACIETKDLIATGKVFHKLVNPKRSVPDEAYKVHGFSQDFLSDKETFEQIADEFLNFIKDKKIIIHNAEFDISHLNNELSIAGKPEINKENTIDTLDIARNKFPGSGISLDALCKRFRIDNSKREKHTALIDCELLAKVYINLLDQKEPKLNFSNSVEINSTDTQDKKMTYSKKIVYPTPEELEQHKEFLKRDLKKNFY